MAAVAVGLAAWSGGFGARVNGDDLYVAFLPKHAYIAESLRAGRFPLWNPFEYCGLPLHGVGQGSALYAPLVAANLVLPALQAMRLVYALHIAAFLVLVLAYLCGRGIGRAAAAGGAAIASACFFNGVALAGIDHPHFFFAALYLVAILLAWEAVLAGHAWAPAVLALCAGIQWLPGYPEFPVETALVLLLIAALGPRPRRLHRMSLATLLVALGAVMAAAQVLPLAETVAESVRLGDVEHFAFTRHLVFAIKGPADLADQVLARYGGAGLFVVLVGALVPSRERLAWLLAFLWCTFPANPPFAYLYQVWPLSGFRFAFGWNLIAPFFAGCLAASGADALRRGDPVLPAWAAPALGLVLAAFALGVGAGREAVVALVCGLSALPALRGRGAWCVPLALVLVHTSGIMGRIGTLPRQRAPDVHALAPRAKALRDLREAVPGAPRVVAGLELRAGLALPARLPNPDGYEPAVAPRRVARLGRHLGLDALSWGGENLMGTWGRLAAAPGAARALGIGIVAVTPLQAPPLLSAGYRKLADLPDGNLALLQPAPARFQVVHRVARSAGEEASFRAVTDPTFDPASTVVVEVDVPVPATPGPAPDQVRVLGETPEEIRLTAELAAPGVLVMRDTYFPGWEARVDGKPAPILRANYAFRGLALPAGTHGVELTYQPLSFRLGVALSLVGFIAVAIVAREGRVLVRAVQPPAAAS